MCLNNISKNIFVINLKKRVDRLNHIENELKKINCDSYEIVEAIDGNTLKPPFFLSLGMLGLVHTYFKIFEMIKDKSIDEIIIVEDDCVFDENFCEQVESFMNEVPDDWSMLYFGGNHNEIARVRPPVKISKNVLRVHHTYSAHCVVIKTKIFFELIQILYSLKIQNDVGLSVLQKRHPCYTTSKKITWQIPTYSDIEKKVVNYNSTLKDA